MRRFITEAGVDEIIRPDGEGGYELIGARCRHCGHVMFPALRHCIRCSGDEMEAQVLSKTGIIYTYTQTMRPVHHMPAGTITGYIDLDDGVRIFAPIDAGAEGKVQIGTKAEIIFRPLWTEEDGTEVLGYAARQMEEEA